MSGDALQPSAATGKPGAPGHDPIERAAAVTPVIKAGPPDNSWLFTSCSVRGTSHERKGMPNQDYVQISCERNGPPLPIRVALADGHGSQRSFRSQIGSQLAVQAAMEELMAMQAAGLLDKTLPEVEAACEGWGAGVWKRWQKSVLEHIAQNPFTEKEFQNHPDLQPADPAALGGIASSSPALPGIKQSGDHLPIRYEGPTSPPPSPEAGFFSNPLPEDWAAEHQPAQTSGASGAEPRNADAGKKEELAQAESSESSPAAEPAMATGTGAPDNEADSAAATPAAVPVDTSDTKGKEDAPTAAAPEPTPDSAQNGPAPVSASASTSDIPKTRRLPPHLRSVAPLGKSVLSASAALIRPLRPGEEPPIEWFVAYGSTILAVLITERWLFISQLGDGDILLVDDAGHVTRPLPQDKKLFANETTSLCCPDADIEFRLKVISLELFSPSVILLATDGYANSFQSDEGFLQVGTDIWNIICECGFDVIPRDIESWLRDASREGSGDDISVGILCRAALAGKGINANAPAPASLLHPPG